MSMFVVMAIWSASLYAAAFYPPARPQQDHPLVFGLLLLGHAANLLIFTAGGITGQGPRSFREAQSRPAGRRTRIRFPRR
jgi:multisubunit Na+/H+ antiporter MnhC subunit